MDKQGFKDILDQLQGWMIQESDLVFQGDDLQESSIHLVHYLAWRNYARCCEAEMERDLGSGIGSGLSTRVNDGLGTDGMDVDTSDLERDNRKLDIQRLHWKALEIDASDPLLWKTCADYCFQLGLYPPAKELYFGGVYQIKLLSKDSLSLNRTSLIEIKKEGWLYYR